MNVKTPMIIVAVFCVLMTLACASEGPASIREGNTAFEAGQFEQAQEAYDRALEAMPDSPEVAYNSANTLYRQELLGRQVMGWMLAPRPPIPVFPSILPSIKATPCTCLRNMKRQLRPINRR